eukprot:g65.t1
MGASSHKACQRCNAGYYQPRAAGVTCIACRRGKYSDQAGQLTNTTCTDCPNARYAPSLGSGSLDGCNMCPPGRQGTGVGKSSPEMGCKICPAGQYADQAGQISCSNCAKGEASAAGAFSCGECFAGEYNAGNNQCVKCAQGFFSMPRSSNCTRCSRGKSSSSGDPVCADCVAGKREQNRTCVPCKAGLFALAGSTQCSACSEGRYSRKDRTTCEPCGKGHFSAAVRATSKSACKPCPVATYSGAAGASAEDQCNPCQVGRYATAGPGQVSASACQSCPVGRHGVGPGIAGLDKACKKCEAGVEYQDQVGQANCLPSLCSPGTYATSTVVTSDAATRPPKCSDCPPGHYSSATGAKDRSACNRCSQGRFSPKPAARAGDACQLCPRGKRGLDEGKATEKDGCEQCTGLQYQDEPGKPTCKPSECDPGSYGLVAADGGNKERPRCFKCGPGRWSSSTGISSESECNPCPSGRWSDSSGVASSLDCISCPAGRNGGDVGLSSKSMCSACAAGQYQPEKGRVSCINCPLGKYARASVRPAIDLTKVCADCAAGRYGVTHGLDSADSCTPCPAGRWSSRLGATAIAACAGCAPGRFGAEFGLARADDCEKCDTNSYQDQPGATQCKPGVCRAGQYGKLESTGSVSPPSCAPCPAGTFSSVAGLQSITQCGPCPRGTWSSTVGASIDTTCKLCAEGRFSDRQQVAAQDGCRPCPDATPISKPSRTGCGESPIMLDPMSFIETEGTQTSYVIELSYSPTAPVTITISPEGLGSDLILTPMQVVLEAGDRGPRTIAVDFVADTFKEDTEEMTVVHRVESGDTRYGELLPFVQRATIVDRNTAAVRFRPSEDMTVKTATMLTNEGDVVDIYFVLLSEPVSDVVLRLHASLVDADADQSYPTVQLVPSSITYTPAEWGARKQVTFRAHEDDVAHLRRKFRVTAVCESGDPNYNGAAADTPTAEIMVVDSRDSPGLVFERFLTVVEGSASSFGLHLASRPRASVSVTVDASAFAHEIQIDQATVVISPSSWDQTQHVQVSALHDTTGAGEEDSDVSVAFSVTSGDSQYEQLSVAPFVFAVINTESNVRVVKMETQLQGFTRENFLAAEQEAFKRKIAEMMGGDVAATDVVIKEIVDSSTTTASGIRIIYEIKAASETAAAQIGQAAEQTAIDSDRVVSMLREEPVFRDRIVGTTLLTRPVELDAMRTLDAVQGVATSVIEVNQTSGLIILEVRWVRHRSAEARSYQLQCRALAPDGSTNTTTLDVDVNVYTGYDFRVGTTYEFRVAAVGERVKGLWSHEGDLWERRSFAAPTQPSAVHGVRSAGRPFAARVQWNFPDEDTFTPRTQYFLIQSRDLLNTTVETRQERDLLFVQQRVDLATKTYTVNDVPLLNRYGQRIRVRGQNDVTLGQWSPWSDIIYEKCQDKVEYFQSQMPLRNQTCAPCPHGGACPADAHHAHVAAVRNFWMVPWQTLAAPELEIVFSKCPVDDICLEGGNCTTGHTGNVCMECEPGTSRQGTTCYKCWSSEASIAIVVILSVLFVTAVIYLVLFHRTKKKKKRMILVRQLVNLLQILGASDLFKAKGTKLYQEVVGAAQMVGGSAVNYWPVQCAVNLNYWLTFGAVMCIPVLIVLMPYMIAIVTQPCTRRRIVMSSVKDLLPCGRSNSGNNLSDKAAPEGANAAVDISRDKNGKNVEQNEKEEGSEEESKRAHHVGDDDDSDPGSDDSVLDVSEDDESKDDKGNAGKPSPGKSKASTSPKKTPLSRRLLSKLLKKKGGPPTKYIVDANAGAIRGSGTGSSKLTARSAASQRRRSHPLSLPSQQSSQEEETAEEIAKAAGPLSASIFLLHFGYQALVLRVLSVFMCSRYIGTGSYRKRFLIDDFSIECYTGEHWAGMMFAVGFGVLYCLGIPLALVVYLRRHKERLQDDGFFQRYGFLYNGYDVSKDLYWWEAVVMARKVAVVSIASFFEDAYHQLIAVSLLMAFALSLNLHFRPYGNEKEGDRGKILNNMESLSLAVLLISHILAFLWLRHEELERRLLLEDNTVQKTGMTETTITVMLLAVVFGAIMVFVYFIARAKHYLEEEETLDESPLQQMRELLCHRLCRSREYKARRRKASKVRRKLILKAKALKRAKAVLLHGGKADAKGLGLDAELDLTLDLSPEQLDKLRAMKAALISGKAKLNDSGAGAGAEMDIQLHANPMLSHRDPNQSVVVAGAVGPAGPGAGGGILVQAPAGGASAKPSGDKSKYFDYLMDADGSNRGGGAGAPAGAEQKSMMMVNVGPGPATQHLNAAVSPGGAGGAGAGANEVGQPKPKPRTTGPPESFASATEYVTSLFGLLDSPRTPEPLSDGDDDGGLSAFAPAPPPQLDLARLFADVNSGYLTLEDFRAIISKHDETIASASAHSGGGGGGSSDSGGRRGGAAGDLTTEELLNKVSVLESQLKTLGLDTGGWDGTLTSAQEAMRDLAERAMAGDGDAMVEIEKWEQIINTHPEHLAAKAKEDKEWEETYGEKHKHALVTMKRFVPPEFRSTSVDQLVAEHDMPRKLARRLLQDKRVLQFVWTAKSDIARLHAGDLKGIYSWQGLDIVEMRAVYEACPKEFDNDGDGAKKAWRDTLKDKLKELSKKEASGGLIKSETRNNMYKDAKSSYFSPMGIRRPRFRRI